MLISSWWKRRLWWDWKSLSFIPATCHKNWFATVFEAADTPGGFAGGFAGSASRVSWGVFLSQSGDNATGLHLHPSLLIIAIKADKRAAKVAFSTAAGQNEAAFEDHTGTQVHCRWGGGRGGDYSGSQLGSVCMSAPLSWWLLQLRLRTAAVASIPERNVAPLQFFFFFYIKCGNQPAPMQRPCNFHKQG